MKSTPCRGDGFSRLDRARQECRGCDSGGAPGFTGGQAPIVKCQPSEVRGRLVDYLDRGYCKLTSSAVSNVFDGLRAKARLSYHIDPPAWLGDDAPAWDSTRYSRLSKRDASLAHPGCRQAGLLAAGNPAAVCSSGPRL